MSEAHKISLRLPEEFYVALAQRMRPNESEGLCAQRLLMAVLKDTFQEDVFEELDELKQQVKKSRDDLGKVAVLILTRDQKQPLTMRDAMKKVTQLFES